MTPNDRPPDGRQHDVGDTIHTDAGEFEVTAVHYQEDQDGNKINFSYSFRSREDLNAEKKQREEADRLAEEQRLAAEEQAQREADEEAAHHNPPVSEGGQ